MRSPDGPERKLESLPQPLLEANGKSAIFLCAMDWMGNIPDMPNQPHHRLLCFGLQFQK
jgi:hypothetical protein